MKRIQRSALILAFGCGVLCISHAGYTRTDRAESTGLSFEPSTLSIPRPARITGWGELTTDLKHARMSRSAILDTYAGSLPPEADKAEVTQEASAEADRLLEHTLATRGQIRIDEFAQRLREVLRLDPTRAEAWRMFGVAQYELGNALATRTALANAFSRGDRSFDTLMYFGIVCSQFRDDPAATSLLLAALDHPDLSTDPAARFIASAEVGRTLMRLGHAQAAAELLAHVKALPETFDQSTKYRALLDELYRSRRELLLLAAEAHTSIDRPADALSLMSTALALPGSVSSIELAQHVYLLLRTGDAEAAVDVVLSIFRDGQPTREAADLLIYVAAHSNAEELIREEIRAIREKLDPDRAALVRQPFALAEAAVTSAPDRRLKIYLDHLVDHPLDREVLIAFARAARADDLDALLTYHPVLEPVVIPVAIELQGQDLRGAELLPIGIRRAAMRGDSQSMMLLSNAQVEADTVSYSALRILTSTLVDAGEGAKADQMLDRAAQAADSPSRAIATAAAMIERGRYRDAIGLLTGIDGFDPYALIAQIELARVHLRMDDSDRARMHAETAYRLDPGCVEAAVLLLHIGGDTETRGALKRDLPVLAGSEQDLMVIRAQQAIERQQLDIAERILSELVEHPLAPEEAEQLLVRVWMLSDHSTKAERWLRLRITDRPDRTSSLILLSRVLSELRRPEESLDVIAGAMIPRPGSPALSRELERILREDLGIDDRWLSQARSRLANSPQTFLTLAERAEIELIAGNLVQSLSLAELAVDLASTPAPLEVRVLNRFLVAASGELISRTRLPTQLVDAYTRVYHSVSNPSPSAMLSMLSVLAAQEIPEIEAIAELAHRTSLAHQDLREEAYIHAAQQLLISSRTGQSTLNEGETHELVFELYSRAFRNLEEYPSEILGEWLDLAQQTMSVESMADAISTLGEQRGAHDRRLHRALSYMMTKGTARREMEGTNALLADAAQYLGSLLATNGYFPAARPLYEEALRLQPMHVETNNSYGYHLLGINEDLDRAVAMIEIAYRQAPNDAHIVDSMGWARYKQGKFADFPHPQTGRVQSGAVSLLRRAKTLAAQQDPSSTLSAFVVAHLGDALWAAGEPEQAAVEWAEAAAHAQRALRESRRTGLTLSLEVDLQAVIDGASERLTALSEDRRPPIEPFASQGD